jgi:fructose-bisphosphate aldolase, class II
MPLLPTRALLEQAHADGVGLAAFNVLHLESAEAFAAAAEAVGAPVVLQLSENCVRWHGALKPIALACAAVAEASSAPLALHLDHAVDPELVREAIGLGFGSVMIDQSALPYDENVAVTAALAAEARAAGVAAEGELGEIGGKDGAHAPGVRTDPAEARAFVEQTGVDALAVAIGSSHAMTERTATLDLELLARIRTAVPVPLVLHGSSGVPDDTIRAAIAAGMTKVNVATQLSGAYTAGVRRRLGDDPALVDSRKWTGEGRRALQDEAERMLRVITREAPDATR